MIGEINVNVFEKGRKRTWGSALDTGQIGKENLVNLAHYREQPLTGDKC
jgi:hypothetical protein